MVGYLDCRHRCSRRRLRCADPFVPPPVVFFFFFLCVSLRLPPAPPPPAFSSPYPERSLSSSCPASPSQSGPWVRLTCRNESCIIPSRLFPTLSKILVHELTLLPLRGHTLQTQPLWRVGCLAILQLLLTHLLAWLGYRCHSRNDRMSIYRTNNL